MSNYSKSNNNHNNNNNTNNELDNYDAEIVEDIPEQFDLSRYRKQHKKISMENRDISSNNNATNQSTIDDFNSNYIKKSSKYNGNEIIIDNYYGYNIDPYNNRVESIIDPNFHQNKSILYNSDYQNIQNLPISGHQTLQKPKPIYHHPQLPFITGSPLTPSSHIQAPIPQYPNQNQQLQQQGSGLENYAGSSKSSTVFDPQQNIDFNIKKKTSQHIKNNENPSLSSSSGYSHDENRENDLGDQKHLYYRRKLRNEEKSKSPMTRNASSIERKENTAEFYTKDIEYSKKTQFNNTSPESNRSGYSDEILKPSKISDHRSTNALNNNDHHSKSKSNLKPSKKHGVKFDEKLEVYEVNNPHYGTEAKSEKREMKKKKKDKKKEDEILHKTKYDIKAKIQAQKYVPYIHYENVLISIALKYYEENYYRGFILKSQDKMPNNNKIDEKFRDQYLQSVDKDNQMTIEIINLIKNAYLNKLQQFCIQFQCQPETLHGHFGMTNTMHNIANSLNYIEIINNHCKEIESGTSIKNRILGHSKYESKDDKSQLNTLLTIKSPIKRKNDIMPPKIILNAIDSHVRDVAFNQYKTLTDLIYKLKEICENELHLARAIFKFILITQLETLRNNESGSYLMISFDMGLENANTIFSRLCSFAGIENRFIRGLWKNITCDPGEKIDSKCLWNAVYLTSGWGYIQPAFTPVRYYSKPEIKFEETDFYFLTDQESLNYEFYSLDKSWIFNDSSLTVKDFEKRPIITPCFRTINLSIINKQSNIITTIDKEPFKLTIQYPHSLADVINFKYRLKLISNSKSSLTAISDQNCESHFNQYVISEIITNEDAVIFKVPALPEIGIYNLTIFADSDDSHSNSSSFLINFDNYKAIASFKLVCNKVLHFETPPNHINEINVFGMNNFMKKLGLVCCDFNKGVIGTDREGKVNLVFEMLQPLDIEVYLYSSDVSISSKFLELCILKRLVHNFLIVIIYPPHPGLYGLDLHGAPKGTFNSLLHSHLPTLGKYLIKSHHQVRSFIQFPKGDNRDWGPKQRFYDLGLHTVSNIDPYIINEDGKQIEIEIAMLNPLTMWYKFDYDMNGTTKAIDNYCFMNYKTINKRDKVVSFLLRFPYRGFYHLAIMATEIYPSKPDEIVYNYLIRVQDPANDIQKFPIIVNPILWRECSLITPKNYLLSNYDTHFSVIVPNTSCVQITTDDGVSENLEAKEIENSWVGLVSLYNAKFVHVEIEFDGRIHRLIRFKGPDNNN